MIDNCRVINVSDIFKVYFADHMIDNCRVINVSDIFKVYCADHSYCTLRLPMDTTVQEVIQYAGEKLSLGHHDVVLCEVKSSGGNYNRNSINKHSYYLCTLEQNRCYQMTYMYQLETTISILLLSYQVVISVDMKHVL